MEAFWYYEHGRVSWFILKFQGHDLCLNYYGLDPFTIPYLSAFDVMLKLNVLE